MVLRREVELVDGHASPTTVGRSAWTVAEEKSAMDPPPGDELRFLPKRRLCVRVLPPLTHRGGKIHIWAPDAQLSEEVVTNSHLSVFIFFCFLCFF